MALATVTATVGFIVRLVALAALLLLGTVAALLGVRDDTSPLFWWLIPTDNSLTRFVRTLPDGAGQTVVVQSQNSMPISIVQSDTQGFWYSIPHNFAANPSPRTLARRSYDGRLLHHIPLPNTDALFWLHVAGDTLIYEVRQRNEAVYRIMQQPLDADPDSATTLHTSPVGTMLLQAYQGRLLLVDRTVQLTPPFSVAVRLLDTNTPAPPQLLLDTQNGFANRSPSTPHGRYAYLESVIVDEPIRRFFAAHTYRVDLLTGTVETLHHFQPGTELRVATDEALVYETDDMLYLRRYDATAPQRLGPTAGQDITGWRVSPDRQHAFFVSDNARTLNSFSLNPAASNTSDTSGIPTRPVLRLASPGSSAQSIQRYSPGEPVLVAVRNDNDRMRLLRLNADPNTPPTTLLAVTAYDMTISRALESPYAYVHYVEPTTGTGVAQMVNTATGTVKPLPGLRASYANTVKVGAAGWRGGWLLVGAAVVAGGVLLGMVFLPRG